MEVLLKEDKKRLVFGQTDQTPICHQSQTVERLVRRSVPLPISVLPPEVLSWIFALVRASCKWPQPSRWIWVSHVCTQWRQVALSDSSLWSDINVSLGKLAETMFHRSGMAPLQVHGQLPEGYAPEMARLISRNFYRIHYLNISSRLECFDKLEGFLFDSQGLSGAAPLLDKVHLDFGCEKANPCLFLLQDSFKLAPRLHTFELNNAHIVWGKHCFLHCTHTLASLSLSHVNSPLLDELLGVFRSLSGLRFVSLVDCLPPCSTTDSLPRFPPVALDHLENLSIAGPSMACAVLLVHLQHPPYTNVFIQGKTYMDDPLVTRTCFSIIAKHFRLESNNRLSFLRTVSFECEWEKHLERYMEVRASNQYNQLFRVRLNVICPQETPQFRSSILQQAFYVFFDTFNTSQLNTIEFFGICSDLSPTALHTCCGTLPHLKTIKLNSRYSLNTICHALGNTSVPSRTHHTWDQQNITYSFPALTTLIICETSPLLSKDIEVLIQMAKSRHGCGVPIMELEFDWCRCLKHQRIFELQENITNPILVNGQIFHEDLDIAQDEDEYSERESIVALGSD